MHREADEIRTDVEGAGGMGSIKFKIQKLADLGVMSQPQGHTQDYASCKLQDRTPTSSFSTFNTLRGEQNTSSGLCWCMWLHTNTLLKEALQNRRNDVMHVSITRYSF